MYHSFQSAGCFCFCRGNLHKLILHDLCPEGSQLSSGNGSAAPFPVLPDAEPAPAPLFKGDKLSLEGSAAQAPRPPSLQSQKDQRNRNGAPQFRVTQGYVSEGHRMVSSAQETAPTACPRPLWVKQHHPRGASEAGKERDPASPSPHHWNPGPCSASALSQPQFPNLGVGGTPSIPVLKVAGGRGVQLAHRSESRCCLWAEGCRQQCPRRQPRSQLAEDGRTLSRGLLSPRRSSIIQTITAPLFKV